MSNVLRKIPSVSEVLESPPLKTLVQRASRHSVVAAARRFLDNLSSQLQTAAATVHVPGPTELAQQIADWIAQDRSSIVPVINATGIVLHPALGGAPLAEDAVAAASALGRSYASVDLDLTRGEPADRANEVEAALVRLTGSEAAVVVNNSSGALLIAVAALAAPGEVLAARGELGERPDGTRIADVVAAAGAALREVGATNIVRRGDWAAAIGQPTRAILRAPPSGFAVTGRSESVALTELAALARQHSLPVIDYLEQCSLVDLSRYGLADCAVAGESIRGGADLVVCGADQWIGGPECGIIAGRSAFIERVRQHPLLAALQVNKLSLAALAATLALYADLDLAERSLPVLSLLATAIENLRQRAERLAPQLAACGIATVQVQEGQSCCTGDGLAQRNLPTVALVLTPTTGSAAALAAALRTSQPPVVGRLTDSQVWLDLRSVLPREDVQLVTACEALQRPTPAGQSARVPPEA